MARTRKIAEKKAQAQLRIEWEVPPGMPAAYANNLVVQHAPTEFVLSFFQIIVPIIVGEPEEVAQRLQAIGTVRPECVARVVVPKEKMKEFVTLMQKNLDGLPEPNEGA
jgi:hypothetical protein